MSAAPTLTTSRFRRPLAIAILMTASAGLLQACGTRDGMSTGAIPDDYRTRHPITLSEAEHTLDIPVASGDHRLTIAMKDSVAGFAQSYQAKSSGSIQIMVPRGSANAGAAAQLKKQIRSVLVASGVPSQKILETAYSAEPQGDAAPIRLSYVAITAMTGQCGEWPEDLSNNTLQNKNWYNFGCASQNNLAAQVANPMDLLGPRGMSPIDAERRSIVIDKYRTGATTTSN